MEAGWNCMAKQGNVAASLEQYLSAHSAYAAYSDFETNRARALCQEPKAGVRWHGHQAGGCVMCQTNSSQEERQTAAGYNW